MGTSLQSEALVGPKAAAIASPGAAVATLAAWGVSAAASWSVAYRRSSRTRSSGSVAYWRDVRANSASVPAVTAAEGLLFVGPPGPPTLGAVSMGRPPGFGVTLHRPVLIPPTKTKRAASPARNAQAPCRRPADA